MIPLQFEPYSQTGSIALPTEDFEALESFEGYRGAKAKMDILSDILDRIPGVSRTDYSGHYGAQIVLTLDVDEPASLDKVKLAINERLTLCRAWAAPVARYLVTHADLRTGETVSGVSPSDLFEAESSAIHNGEMHGERVYGVTVVGPPTDGVWMIRTDDLRE